MFRSLYYTAGRTRHRQDEQDTWVKGRDDGSLQRKGEIRNNLNSRLWKE